MHGERGKGKQITASEHIEMNSELVKKRITSFKLLSREHHKTNSRLLTLQFKKEENVNGISKTQEIHTMRENITHITTIRIFS
jgi:hypothetical protein